MVGVSRTTLSVSIYVASSSSYFNFGHQFDKLYTLAVKCASDTIEDFFLNTN
jgi:hypothetical protein